MKVAEYEVVFREFPDEVTLALNISGCPNRCPHCHSSYLQQDIGEILTQQTLDKLIEKEPEVTCIGFMGGDNCPDEVSDMAMYIKRKYKDKKVGWYSGRTWEKNGNVRLPVDERFFDYIKLGPYDENRGPLDNPNTNQRMYKNTSNSSNINEWIDITEKFWRKDIKFSNQN